MTKYIRTVEKDDTKEKHVILRLSKCNDCPCMKFNYFGLIVKCAVFRNINSSNVIKSSLSFYDSKNVIEKIEIPFWCKLPNDAYEAKTTKKTFIKNKDSVLILYKELEDDNIKIIDGSLFKKSEIKENYDLINFFENNGSDIPFIPNNEQCSSCGNFNETVIRNVNDGMCDSCLKIYSDNKNKNIHINNFRLKRGAKFINKDFKHIR